VNPVAPVDVVLDDSALLALGSGNVLASRLLYQAAETGTWRVHVALATLAEKLEAAEWNKAAISAAIKETIGAHGIKMPALAIPVRVLVCGRTQTPSVDAALELFDKKSVVERLRAA